MKEKRLLGVARVCLTLVLLVTALAACASKEEPAKSAAPSTDGN